MKRNYLFILLFSHLVVLIIAGHLIWIFQIDLTMMPEYDPAVLHNKINELKRYHNEKNIIFLEKLVAATISTHELNLQNLRVFKKVLPLFVIVFWVSFLQMIYVIYIYRRLKKQGRLQS